MTVDTNSLRSLPRAVVCKQRQTDRFKENCSVDYTRICMTIQVLLMRTSQNTVWQRYSAFRYHAGSVKTRAIMALEMLGVNF